MSKAFTKVRVMNNLWEKSFGVIGWKDFGEFEGVLLTKTNSIHTFFVRFPIDVVFLDKNNLIIRLVENLKPWSFSPIVWKAYHTLELPNGSIKKRKLALSDKINLE